MPKRSAPYHQSLPTRMQLNILGATVLSIERAQRAKPQFREKVLREIVDLELRQLEKEMGVGLDEVAEGRV